MSRELAAEIAAGQHRRMTMKSKSTYTVREHGAYWIVEDGTRKVAKYRKDEVAYNGYTDILELKRIIREDLHLRSSDIVTIAP